MGEPIASSRTAPICIGTCPGLRCTSPPTARARLQRCACTPTRPRVPGRVVGYSGHSSSARAGGTAVGEGVRLGALDAAGRDDVRVPLGCACLYTVACLYCCMQDYINMEGRRRTGVFRKRVSIYCCTLVLLHAEGATPGPAGAYARTGSPPLHPWSPSLSPWQSQQMSCWNLAYAPHGIPHARRAIPRRTCPGADARRKLGRCWRV